MCVSYLLLQVGLEEKDASEETYRGLLGKLMQDDSKPLVDAYGAIESLLGGVDSYVNVSMQCVPINNYCRVMGFVNDVGVASVPELMGHGVQ